MKKIPFTVILILVLNTFAYSQLGWYFQNSGTSSQLNTIKFFNGNTAWVAGWNPNIFKTTNGGLNWNQTYSGNNVSYQCAHFANSNTGWVVGASGTIVKTTDGGATWTTQYSGVSTLLMYVHFYDAQIGWIVGYGGTYLKTTNGGTNWVIKNSGVSYNLLCIYFLGAYLGFFSGDGGTIKRSTDGGESWTTIPTPLTYNLDKFFFINNNTGWVTGINGTVLKTTNSGLNWLFTYTGTTNWITAVYFFDEFTGYACGGDYSLPTGGMVLKSVNGGNSWTPTTHPQIPWMAFLNFVSSDTGWAVGKNGLIMKTVDGGNPPPVAPALISPQNDSLVGTLTPTLYWSSCTGAQNYTYHVSRFGAVIDSGTTTFTNHAIPTGKLTPNYTYQWKVKASNVAGASQWSPTWIFTVYVTSLTALGGSTPSNYTLYQNYPNPFNPTTKIRFDIPKSSNVKLSVFNINGQEVENLYAGAISAGSFEYNWNASKLSSGIYFARLETKEFVSVKRMMLVK